MSFSLSLSSTSPYHSKQSSGKPTCADPFGDLWHFNPIDVTTTILKDPVIRGSMHFGLRQLVVEEEQLWHSRVWGESILGTSGQYFFYNQTAEDPVFQGDVAIYKGGQGLQVGLIREVAQNFMPDATEQGEVIAIVDEIIPRLRTRSFFTEAQLI